MRLGGRNLALILLAILAILAGVNILDVSKYIFHAESVLQDVGKSASKTSLVVTAIVDEYSWQSSDLIGKQG